MEKGKIGERLRALRGDRSREEVGAAIGITSQAVFNYETGARIPTDDIKRKIAAFFGCTVQEIFFDD